MKVQELENHVAVRKEKVEKCMETYKEKQEMLKKIMCLRIQQLFKFIFPITIVEPTM